MHEGLAAGFEHVVKLLADLLVDEGLRLGPVDLEVVLGHLEVNDADRAEGLVLVLARTV